jgi:small subunit ribosomal protein S15
MFHCTTPQVNWLFKQIIMLIDKKIKSEVISTFATQKNDTGSPEVQVALLTARIQQITKHLQINTKDFSGRRGLLILIGQRSRLLSYLKRTDGKRYQTLISKLNLKDKK